MYLLDEPYVGKKELKYLTEAIKSGFKSKVFHINKSALVPLAQLTAYFVPIYEANFFSNRFTNFP